MRGNHLNIRLLSLLLVLILCAGALVLPSSPKNYVVNGDATFVITGGSFKKEFITYCACGDLLLKYDPVRVQSDFLSLCANFPIRQTVDSSKAPDTESEYVQAQIDQQIDKLAHGADPYVIKDPHDDCYYYVYSSGGVKITKSGNIGLFKQGTTAANSAGSTILRRYITASR